MRGFLRVCEGRKLRVNVGKCKVIRFSRYIKVGLMHVTLNGKPLEEIDCFKYLGSQVSADGGLKGIWFSEFMRGIKCWCICR